MPLLCLTVLGGWTAWTNWRTADQMHSLSELARLAPTISQAIHELQKERGASAIVIGSEGQAQAALRLSSQRRETDARLVELNQAIGSFDTGTYGDAYTARVRSAQATLGKLSSERNAVDAPNHKVADMARYYTGAIRNLLGLIEPMTALSADAEITSAIAGYLALLEAKESAGLERAMGAAGFGAGKFSNELHRKLITLIGRQDAYFATFGIHASGEQHRFFQNQMAGNAVQEVERLRQIAIDSPFTQDLGNVSGAHWFDATTRRIDLLKAVEDRLSVDLVSLAGNLEASARSQFQKLAGFLTLLTLTLGGLGMLMANGISRPINGIVDAIARYQPGDRLTMPGSDRRDELGKLARSLDVIAKTGLESSRLKAALEACQTHVMIANRSKEIIYLNPNLQRMLKSAEAEIKKQLPQFDADSLLGTSIDRFHKNPAHQRAMLDSLRTTHTAKIELGALKFQLAVSPVLGTSGESLGTVVEWHDRTAEMNALAEIDGVIAAANRGELDRRLTEDGKDGFMLDLAKGINQLTSVVDDVTADVGDMLKGLANGDLRREITRDYQGRFGDLKRDANDTARKLIGIVSDIQTAANEVKTAASEITSGTEDLAGRTEQAAANVEETAAAADEMAATVKQNAENAKNASELAGSADQSARRGGDVTKKAVTAMAGIEGSAKKITDIISVIDEIAFQTNLLALNASVEAARAGDAGKGFAVVAQEVRQLAQRAGNAANDIKDLIQDSNGQVTAGVQLVNQAGEALTEIVGSIGKAAAIVEEISSASQEQAIGVQEINNSINNMDEMTQQNSALVEESSAAAKALSDQAARLAELMAFFKLDGATPGAGPRKARKAPPRTVTSQHLVPAGEDEQRWSEF